MITSALTDDISLAAYPMLTCTSTNSHNPSSERFTLFITFRFTVCPLVRVTFLPTCSCCKGAAVSAQGLVCLIQTRLYMSSNHSLVLTSSHCFLDLAPITLCRLHVFAVQMCMFCTNGQRRSSDMRFFFFF